MAASSPAPAGRSLVGRVRAILLDPRSEWPLIAEESATIASIYVPYVLVLAAIPAVCYAIGQLGIGSGLPVYGAVRFSPMWAIRSALRVYVESLIAVYITALIIAALAPLFSGRKDRIQALKVSAYSSTAVCIAGVFAVIPGLAIARLVGAIGLGFSLYLLYLGLPVVMQTPPTQARRYTVATLFVLTIIFCAIIVAANQFRSLI
jgi:hypothetical protein